MTEKEEEIDSVSWISGSMFFKERSEAAMGLRTHGKATTVIPTPPSMASCCCCFILETMQKDGRYSEDHSINLGAKSESGLLRQFSLFIRTTLCV